MLYGIKSCNRKYIRLERISVDILTVALLFDLRSEMKIVSRGKFRSYDTELKIMVSTDLLTLRSGSSLDLAVCNSSILVDCMRTESDGIFAGQCQCVCYLLSARCEQVLQDLLRFDWRFAEAFTFNDNSH